jgi:hypothetical protein
MLEVKPVDNGQVMILKLSGVVTEADGDKGIVDIQEMLGSQSSVRVLGAGARRRILLDWEDLERWEKGAKTFGTLIGLNIRDMIDRVAIVAAEKWRDEEARIADVCKHGKVRFFTPEQREAALAWLRE